jgi:large subunit ribosomal protein L15
MAEAKSTRKKSTAKTAAAPKKKAASGVARGAGLKTGTPSVTLATLRENAGARPKRVRIGRGHGSGMVKTGGEGGKGQTVRSGGGKGPAFEGGQTPWARRLPHKRGYSQKGRDTGHFGSIYAVVNIASLSGWDPAVEVSPQSLAEKKLVTKGLDGVKILGGTKAGKTLPQGLRFLFSASAREALGAAGADFGDAGDAAEARA